MSEKKFQTNNKLSLLGKWGLIKFYQNDQFFVFIYCVYVLCFRVEYDKSTLWIKKNFFVNCFVLTEENEIKVNRQMWRVHMYF
jgi:hypothetical protein